MTARAQSLFSQPLLECVSKSKIRRGGRQQMSAVFQKACQFVSLYVSSFLFSPIGGLNTDGAKTVQTLCAFLHAVKRFFALFCGG